MELSLSMIEELAKIARSNYCQAMTITGGGEPTIHEDFDEIVYMLNLYGIKTGLVTNGTLLHQLDELSKITWIRVSASDNMARELIRAGSSFNDWIRELSMIIDGHPTVDWAISYVLSEKPNTQLLLDLVQFANDHNMTHMRIVQDILSVEKENWNPLEQAVAAIKKKRLDTSRLNFQDRSNYTKGMNPCFISLLKPVIGADGFL
jgi:molybdenum cofactor biosynthesis enzyme MoaA